MLHFVSSLLIAIATSSLLSWPRVAEATDSSQIATPASAHSIAVAAVDFDVRAFYLQVCAQCHGERRYGGYAPPLIPETLERKQDAALVEAILRGLPNTQMPAFGETLDEANARALLALLREPVGEIEWTLQDIAASHVEEPVGPPRLAPEISRDDLIFVVERGSGDVVVVDGDTLRELDRFPVGQIHGGLKFDLSLRQALAVTRDGTVVDYDLVRGGLRGRVKVGVNTRNIAVSTRGEFVAVANQLPRSLVVLDGRLRPLQSFPLPGQPSAVYQLPGQNRFVLTLRDLPYLYTLRYPEIELERRDLPEPFEDFEFVPGRPQLVASSRGGSRLLLWDLERSELVASLETEGLPHLFSASFFERRGKLLAAFNHMGVPRLTLINMDDFSVVKELPLAGSGYFTRSHEGTPYLFIDTNTEVIQLVDKESLELVERQLIPEAGKKAMHVEFTADGRKALVSVWHQAGAVVVYDSTSLAELERLPFAMPVGKYNPANKTRSLR